MLVGEVVYARQLSLDPGSFSQLQWNQTSSGDNKKSVTLRAGDHSTNIRGYERIPEKIRCQYQDISSSWSFLFIFYDQDMKWLTYHKKRSVIRKKKGTQHHLELEIFIPKPSDVQLPHPGPYLSKSPGPPGKFGDVINAGPVKSKINIVIYSYNIVISYVYKLDCCSPVFLI